MGLNCGDPAVKNALDDVIYEKTQWCIFGYTKGEEKLKVDDCGEGFDDFSESFSDGKVQFGYYRVPFQKFFKFFLVSWVGEGVEGRAKGLSGAHANDFDNFLKKMGYTVHLRINARSEMDMNEEKIMESIKTAGGSNYDAGKVSQGDECLEKSLNQLKSFHINEQSRSEKTLASGSVDIDKSASREYWKEDKLDSKKSYEDKSKSDFKYDNDNSVRVNTSDLKSKFEGKNTLGNVDSFSASNENNGVPGGSYAGHLNPGIDNPPTESVPLVDPYNNATPYSSINSDQDQQNISGYDQSAAEYDQSGVVYDESDNGCYAPSIEIDPHNAGYDVAIADYDFTAEQEGDLTFKAGDYIYVYEKNESGWWEGQLDDGTSGKFPSNYVTIQ